ncbi:MAG: shikimate kinase [Raoultibacter sp.]
MSEEKKNTAPGGKGKQRGGRGAAGDSTKARPRNNQRKADANHRSNNKSHARHKSGSGNSSKHSNTNQRPASTQGAPAKTAAPAKSRPRPSDRFLFHLTRRVFFVGFMGAGKTSVARRVARDCALVAVDMDTYLERSRECKVGAVFEKLGEARFRDLEHDVLTEMTELDPLFISCGGGVIKRSENRRLLRECGFVIYLDVSADEASHRIKNIANRPLFKDLDNARKTNAEREPYYAEVADVTINTAGKSVARIAHEVRRILLKKGVLCQQPK